MLADEVLGTFRYMPPEQLSDARAADSRSDVYSLAATLLHALTGKHPYPERSELDVLTSVAAGRLPPIAPSPEDHLPAGVRELLARCLAAAPADRPEPRQLARELSAVLDALEKRALARALTPGDGTKTNPPRKPPSTKGSIDGKSSSSGRWKVAQAPGGQQGSFTGSELLDLVRTLASTARTGVLDVRLRGGDAVGSLWLREGKLVVARTTTGLRGPEAALEVLGMREGDYELRPGLPGEVRFEHDLLVEPLVAEIVRRRALK
jgi:serine/threonine protein kinase